MGHRRRGLTVAALVLGMLVASRAPAAAQAVPAPAPASAPGPASSAPPPEAPAPGEPAPAPVPATTAPGTEPAPAPATAPSAPPSTTATTTAEPLPRPDQASGILRDEPPSMGDKLRWIPRALLFVPRWTFWAVAQPIRLSAWAYERYNLRARLKGALFNVDETYGVYPVASYSTDFGVAAGLRFVHYDLFGADENLKLRANFGGRFQQAYGFTIDSGERFGEHLSFELEARYERRPSERFFGLGNADSVDEPEDGMRYDPTANNAVSTRFRETLVRVIPTAEIGLLREKDRSISLHLSAAMMLRSFSSGDDDEDIAEVYDVSKLAGFTEGVDNIYIEAELIYDSRRQPSRWQSDVLDATGWYAAAHFGRAVGIDGDPSRFFRYGGELVRFIDLYRSSRVLALRLFLEATASGDGLSDRALPFIDLPRLGGTEYLRGYPEGRFRDRVVALGTAEYTWDLGNMLAAYLFVDVGRPYSLLSRMELEDMRVGFGSGIQLHTQDSFITRAQLAASRDGDVFFELVLSPAFGRRERAGRY